mgnify:CR=1 FL=1
MEIIFRIKNLVFNIEGDSEFYSDQKKGEEDGEEKEPL